MHGQRVPKMGAWLAGERKVASRMFWKVFGYEQTARRRGLSACRPPQRPRGIACGLSPGEIARAVAPRHLAGSRQGGRYRQARAAEPRKNIGAARRIDTGVRRTKPQAWHHWGNPSERWGAPCCLCLKTSCTASLEDAMAETPEPCAPRVATRRRMNARSHAALPALAQCSSQKHKGVSVCLHLACSNSCMLVDDFK